MKTKRTKAAKTYQQVMTEFRSGQHAPKRSTTIDELCKYLYHARDKEIADLVSAAMYFRALAMKSDPKLDLRYRGHLPSKVLNTHCKTLERHENE